MWLISKYWRVTLPLVLLVAFIAFLQIWKADIKKAAINEVIYEIKEQKEVELKKDISVAIESFKPNTTIDSIADEIIERGKNEDINSSVAIYPDDWVQQPKDSDSNRLHSIESDPIISDKRDTKARASVGDERGLSTQEINFINEFSGLLQ